MEQRYCSLEFQDNYDTRIPFYERYAEVRKQISLLAIKNLNEVMSNNNDKITTTDIKRNMLIHKLESGKCNQTLIAKEITEETGTPTSQQWVSKTISEFGLRSDYIE